MAKHRVVLLPGDGIGPEVVASARRVVEASAVHVEWIPMEIGLGAFEKHGDALPEDCVAAVREIGVALKGPTTTPIGGGHRDCQGSGTPAPGNFVTEQGKR